MTSPQKQSASASNSPTDALSAKHTTQKAQKVLSVKISLRRIGIELLKNTRALALLVIGCTFTLLVLFLYKNVYVTMTQAEQVIVLQQEVATEKINITDFNSIKKYLDSRNALQQPATAKNTPSADPIVLPPLQAPTEPSAKKDNQSPTQPPELVQ